MNYSPAELEPSAETGRVERRRARRYPLALGVRVAGGTGVTRNASRDGVLILLDGAAPRTDSPIEFVLAIGDSASAHCAGRVVRAEPVDGGHRVRVAATIERYRIRRSDA